jgi:hypothetical protein
MSEFRALMASGEVSLDALGLTNLEFAIEVGPHEFADFFTP